MVIMQAVLPDRLDLATFTARLGRTQSSDPSRVALAGLNLVDGALRIRRGGDGLYGQVERPVTKPAEAVSAWIKSLERDVIGGGPFYRSAEMQEALVAAAEEVDAAATEMPSAARLRSALLRDALTTVGTQDSSHNSILPWVVAALLGGILVGVLVQKNRK